jgi:hypothetical protein
VAECCEHGNYPSVSITGEEFVDRVTLSFLRRNVLHEVSWLVNYPVPVKVAARIDRTHLQNDCSDYRKMPGPCEYA